MNTLKYSLEYHCYPIRHYDEACELIDNDLPDELKNQRSDFILLHQPSKRATSLKNPRFV